MIESAVRWHSRCDECGAERWCGSETEAALTLATHVWLYHDGPKP